MKQTPESLSIFEPDPQRPVWAGYSSQRERVEGRTAQSADPGVTITLLDLGISFPWVWTERGSWPMSLRQDKMSCMYSPGWGWGSQGRFLSICSPIYSGEGSSVNLGWMSSQLNLNLPPLKTLNLAPVLPSVRAV